jgi:hypothetical protein
VNRGIFSSIDIKDSRVSKPRILFILTQFHPLYNLFATSLHTLYNRPTYSLNLPTSSCIAALAAKTSLQVLCNLFPYSLHTLSILPPYIFLQPTFSHHFAPILFPNQTSFTLLFLSVKMGGTSKYKPEQIFFIVAAKKTGATNGEIAKAFNRRWLFVGFSASSVKYVVSKYQEHPE